MNDLDEKNLKFLTKLRSVLEDDAITRADFTKAFEQLMKVIVKVENDLIKKVNNEMGAKMSSDTQSFSVLKKEVEQMLKEMNKTNDSTFASLRKRAMEATASMFAKLDVQGKMDKMYSEHEAMMAECEAKIPDTEKMMKEMVAKMPPETPESVRDKLESIQEEEQKLAISAIAHLEEKLKDLEKRVAIQAGRPMGGFNYGSLSLHIVDDETPVGTIDGVNTAFTVNNPPSPVSSLKVYRGGARQRITEDYTFSGVTITFTIAPQVGEIILVDYRI